MWKCNKCSAEFSAMLGDNEAPEKCPYCKKGKIKELKVYTV